ncbi:MAG TPA: polysaccharide deacetylase [Vicinamibacteria bacterium]|nr:polysaccharide deacetylase [Vicinamibacteria bacterium]
MRATLVIALTAGLFARAIASAQVPDRPPVWEWSFDEIKAEAMKARAGRDLTPREWPGGARVAVLLSFDLDNESESFITGDTSIFGLTFHEFGARRGLSRILSVLDKEEVPATFFVPAVSAMLAPEMIPAIQHSGRHEIAVHGWIHEYNSKLPPERQRELVSRAIEYLEEHTGKRPVGHRAPWGDVSDDTVKILQDLGLLYDTSMFSDDRPYEILRNGEPTGIVELPINLILEDSVLNVANEFSAGIVNPRDALQTWIDEFDRAHQERTFFLLVAHPHIIGLRSRIMVVEKLIEHMKAKGDVWFATHQQAAEYVKMRASSSQ